MADIQQSSNNRGSKKTRVKRLMVRVDLTPMVDLAFLLITFFMLTTSLTKAKALELDQRTDTKNKQPVSACCVLNILADSLGHFYTYQSDDLQTLQPIDTSELVNAILTKNKVVKQSCGLDKDGKPHEMICLMKLLPGCKYQEMIDLFDAIKLSKIQVYSMQEPVREEIDAVNSKTAELLASGQ